MDLRSPPVIGISNCGIGSHADLGEEHVTASICHVLDDQAGQVREEDLQAGIARWLLDLLHNDSAAVC
ncbi:hypothetical protein ACGF0J_30985 [Nonomuraea sp. NPDC047897]|uniref:hypothetical protein n=1 Tax=Nonomuraea sp. NPDC047897 TaxID=3364346 RepID=UPI00371687B9